MKYIKFEPLFGHLTGRSGHTHWLVFMKGGGTHANTTRE